MSRVQQFSNTLADAGGTPRVGVPITIQLVTPGNVAAVNLESQTIFPGVTSQKSTTTDASGIWNLSVDYPADLTPTGCTYVLNEGGIITVLTTWAYSASPINVRTLYPVFLAGGGTLLMRANTAYVDSTNLTGLSLAFGISDRATTPGGITLPAGVLLNLPTDGSGKVAFNAYITSTLTPNTVAYFVSWPNGTVDYFTVPSTPTGYQGAYNGATAYKVNSGTQVSPADVVLSGGVLYQAIANSTGSAPPSANWQVFPGEPLEWHITSVAGAGQYVWTAANIGAAAAVPGALIGSPATVQDILSNLLYTDKYGNLSFRTVTANTTATASDDVILVDATIGNITVTLQTAVGQAKPLTIVKIDSTTNTVTAAASGGQTVNGAASTVVAGRWNQAELLSNNVSWIATISASVFANPMTTAGDLIVGGAAGAPTRTAAGTTGQILSIVGGVPVWSTVAGASNATPTTTGVVEVDTNPLSGVPEVLTTRRYAMGNGVAPLLGDRQVPSFALPPSGAGSMAEASRWVRQGVIISPTQGWEGTSTQEATVLVFQGAYHMFYTGGWTNPALGHATCPLTSDPTVAGNWTKHTGQVLGQGTGGVAGYVAQNNVIEHHGVLYLYYADGTTGNIRAATSADGNTWTLQGIMLAKNATTWSTQQWANSTVWVENGNQWYMLAEANNTFIWQIGLCTASSPLGPWTAATNPLTTLQVHTGASYGGPYTPAIQPQRAGKYHVWLHAAPLSGNTPTDVYHFTSPDLATWTMVGTGAVATHTGVDPDFDQLADPCVVEANGTSYLFMSGVHNANSTGSVLVYSIAANLAQVADGTAPGSTALAIASATVLGGIKVGSGLTISGAGVLSAAVGTGEMLVQDGTSNPPIMLTTEAQDDFLAAG